MLVLVDKYTLGSEISHIQVYKCTCLDSLSQLKGPPNFRLFTLIGSCAFESLYLNVEKN